MNAFRTLGAAAALAFAALTANGETVLSKTRDWEVTLHTFSDGKPYCAARTETDGMLFSIIVMPNAPTILQLFFPDVELGDGSMDFKMRIDSRAPWFFDEAKTLGNSIYFELPYDDRSTRFISEIWNGRVAYFLDSRDMPLWSISLRGSGASMDMLVRCLEAF